MIETKSDTRTFYINNKNEITTIESSAVSIIEASYEAEISGCRDSDTLVNELYIDVIYITDLYGNDIELSEEISTLLREYINNNIIDL